MLSASACSLATSPRSASTRPAASWTSSSDTSESGNGHLDRVSAISHAAERLFEHDMSSDWSEVWTQAPPVPEQVAGANPWAGMYKLLPRWGSPN